MLNFTTDYLTKLYGLSNEFQPFSMNFKDEVLETKYKEQFSVNEARKSKIFLVFAILMYIYTIYSNLSRNNYIPLPTTNFTYAALVLELVLFIISCYCDPKTKLFHIIKFIRFFLIYAIFSKEMAFPSTDLSLDMRIRSFYRCFFSIIGVYLLYIDFHSIIMILFSCFNLVLIIYIQLYQFERFYLLPEFIGALIIQPFLYFMKKKELQNEKENFFEFLKNNLYIDYIRQLVDVLHTKIISFKKDYEILFMNKFASNFFEKYLSNNNNDFNQQFTNRTGDIPKFFKSHFINSDDDENKFN